MEMIVTVTLLKDNEGRYSLNLNKTTATVSPLDEDGEEVTLRWLLREDEANPDYPNNARSMTASFNRFPTPFSDAAASGTVPSAEVYTIAPFTAGVVTPVVMDSAVGADESAVSLYKYTVTVETNDNQQVVLDPHIRVRRRSVTRGDIFSR